MKKDQKKITPTSWLPPVYAMPYSFPLLAWIKFVYLGFVGSLSNDFATIKSLVAGWNLMMVPPPSLPPLNVVPYKI